MLFLIFQRNIIEICIGEILYRKVSGVHLTQTCEITFVRLLDEMSTLQNLA